MTDTFFVDRSGANPTVVVSKDSLLGLIRTAGEILGLSEDDMTNPDLGVAVTSDAAGPVAQPWVASGVVRPAQIYITSAPLDKAWNYRPSVGTARYAIVTFSDAGYVNDVFCYSAVDGRERREPTTSTASLRTIRDLLDEPSTPNQPAQVVALVSQWVHTPFETCHIDNSRLVDGGAVISNNPDSGYNAWCYHGSSDIRDFTHEPRYARCNRDMTWNVWHRPASCGGREVLALRAVDAGAARDFVANAPRRL